MFKSKKSKIILGIIVIIAGLIVWRVYASKNTPIQYETVKVERVNLIQTVQATGKLQSANDLQLKFETAGTLDNIPVKEGDKVKAGALLATLKASDLNAMIAQAQANLNQKLAGADDSTRAYYKAAMDSAYADWQKAKINTDSSATSVDNNKIVNEEYSKAVALLKAVMNKLDDGLTQADNILGVDNTLANEDFKDYLSILDSSKFIDAKGNYLVAKQANKKVKDAVEPLTAVSAHSDVDAAILLAEDALTKMNTALSNVNEVLTATPPVGTLTQTILDAKKTVIATARVNITTQYSSVIAEQQSLSDASSILAIKEAVYNQAVANYKSKVDPVREVDLAPLRAALAQAVANRDKAYIHAPMDGVVTKINKKKGEFISMSDVAVEMVSPHFEIEVDIPETDVSKLKLNDTTVITLDAFGDDTKFSGKVISIDPASTDIQDVVYYKVKISLDDTGKLIKPGMTANVTISTDKRDNVLAIPARAVRTNSEKYVRVLVGTQTQDMPVKLGMRADDGKIEIIEGLKEGDLVVLGTK